MIPSCLFVLHVFSKHGIPSHVTSDRGLVLQLRNLSIGLGEEPCIGFTQEDSMESSLQNLSLLKYVVTLVCVMTMLLLP